MIICFKEKDGDYFVEGETSSEILSHVLKTRIEDDYGSMFGGEPDGVSVWYDDDTVNAQKALDTGRAALYMESRRYNEYEDYHVVLTKKV